MHHINALLEFKDLAEKGRKAALDVNTETGEVVVRSTYNPKTGETGMGVPPQPYGVSWLRVFEIL